MATTTPNIGLTLPVGTENVSRQVINGNWNLIDTEFGKRKEVKSGTVTISVPTSSSVGRVSHGTQSIGTNITVIGTQVETTSYFSYVDYFDISSCAAYNPTTKAVKLITDVWRASVGGGTINQMSLTVRYFYIEN